MINWSKIAKNYMETGDAGVCPKCKKGKLLAKDFGMSDGFAYTFKCEKCGLMQAVSGYDRTNVVNPST